MCRFNHQMVTKSFDTTPLMMPAISLILGIIAAPFVTGTVAVLVAFVACVVLTWLLGRWAFWQSIGVLVSFVLLGMLVGQQAKSRLLTDEVVDAVVFSEPAEKPKTIAVDLLLPEEGRQVRCYLWKDERSKQLVLGQNLLVRGADKGFVRSGDWQFGGQGRTMMSRVERVRLWFLGLCHRLLIRYRSLQADDDQYAILAAMTLGDKSALRPELRETYSVTGASHVLALSGLHMGIIFFLLYHLTLGHRHSWVSQTVIILGIWAFAFLTGMSSSVVRSAMMISIFALFSVMGRRRSPVNLLCFTAIVMLLVNPASLYDIGFQLSFVAVLSILLWTPLVECFLPDNYLASHRAQAYLFGMVEVSLAAQIGVAPLIAFHFGRFSTYFLLTNFLVMPAATMILYGALVVLVIPGLGPVLLAMVGILNKALGWLSQMPYASIDGLHPSVLQICLLYIGVVTLYWTVRMLAPLHDMHPAQDVIQIGNDHQ